MTVVVFSVGRRDRKDIKIALVKVFIARVGLPFVTTLAKRRRYSFQILVVDQSDRIKSLSRFRNCVSYVSREEEEETRGNISYSVNGVYLEGDKLDGVVVITSKRQMANVKSEPRSSSARLGRKLSPN